MTRSPLRNFAIALAIIALAGSSCSRRQSSTEGEAPSARPVASAPAPVTPTAPDLSVFCWSDLRGHASLSDDPPSRFGSLSRRATLIDQARAASKGVVVVDAGDFLPLETEAGSRDALAAKTNLLLASYKRIGVSVVATGERELSLGPERLRRVLHAAGLRAVASNLVTTAGQRAFDEEPVVDAGPAKVGVFGIVELPPDSIALEPLGLATVDSADAGRKAVASLRERGAKLVVGLLHVAGGTPRAEELVKQIGGVDIVALGHGTGDHGPSAPIVAGQSQIVYAGALGTHIGRVDVSALDREKPVLKTESLAVSSAVPVQLGVSLITDVEAERPHIAEQKAAEIRRKKGVKEPEVYETWTYGSSSACMLCHAAAFAHWKTTPHARAFDTLKESRHERDPACLGCHATGYLQPGGTRSLDYANDQFANVGCESCHGASAPHVRSLNKKKGTSRAVSATVCFGCHTPDQSVGPDVFDYAAALPAIIGPGHGAPAR